jgi:hypothetical protein
MAAVLAAATIAAAEVTRGDTAPTYPLVTEEMAAGHLAEAIDGAPLVLLYGSAT